MIYEWDDFGANHIISDQCQSHDCRDQLDKLHILNPAFKATLFTIPGEMTPELYRWVEDNLSWIELAVHGFYHHSNYECEKMTYDEFDNNIKYLEFTKFDSMFQRIFRAPGWQISTEVMQWLADNNWIIADQSYNNERRPKTLKTWLNHNGEFSVETGEPTAQIIEAYHGHTWDVGWNGIYEDFDKVSDLVKNCKEFKFVSELFV